jgi:hypothetical protein
MIADYTTPEMRHRMCPKIKVTQPKREGRGPMVIKPHAIALAARIAAMPVPSVLTLTPEEPWMPSKGWFYDRKNRPPGSLVLPKKVGDNVYLIRLK